jgi:transcriptional regulator with XRE-family HTH domain
MQMTVAQRIKARRKELGLSADALAEAIGKNRSTIFRYERGDIDKLPIDILKPIAAALKTTPEYLMGWDEAQKNNDVIADVVVRMRTDEEFLSVVYDLSKLDSENLTVIKTMLSALLK